MRQPFHLVTSRPWPFLTGLSAFSCAISLVLYFHTYSFNLWYAWLILPLILIFWFRDIIRESTFMGAHTKEVQKRLKISFLLFIASEVIFFFSFFWAFFHRRLRPGPELGCLWPPIGIVVINPFSIPLLNTAVLLASGFFVTAAHHAIILGKKSTFLWYLFFTILLGVYFTSLQINEYYDAHFTIADSVYGSLFYLITGFHGFHVLVGTMFLFVIWVRGFLNHFSTTHHFGFEAAIWYWHFVDVVWIFLYLIVYIWGS